MITTETLGARGVAVRAGLHRGWLETKYSLTDVGDIFWMLIFPVSFTVTLLFMRGSTVPGTDLALGAMVLPSLIGMSIAFGGLAGPAMQIATDREDGTLLRAKATPDGMLGYLIGKIWFFGLTTLASLVLLAIPAVTVISDLRIDGRTALLLPVIFVVGMIATVPIGSALGSIFKSSAQSMLIMLASMLLIAISGIFYPITAMPTWLQWVGQVFPFYWLGLGTRSAMMPAGAEAAEIGDSWRTAEMFAVLGVWAVVGLVLAPIVLRRMARRQTGSAIAAAREKIMTRGY
ncbi:ABC-2 type transport system permease protein [Nocardioides sp. YR527]|uniref:ABC transporter permease n=1 Tax=Nocardioides sp. YR527 TaxID=1881028 RepID=UPI000888C24A|nr:ABC transporter permease [Nocardioides sp. YR527]SDK93218.1 ABC-2 type transport system permease protein [Nocardioides sp. YR527]